MGLDIPSKHGPILVWFALLGQVRASRSCVSQADVGFLSTPKQIIIVESFDDVLPRSADNSTCGAG